MMSIDEKDLKSEYNHLSCLVVSNEPLDGGGAHPGGVTQTVLGTDFT